MAKNTNLGIAANNTNTSNNRENALPAGYINLSIPDRDGNPKKVGAIRLYENNNLQKKVVDALSNPDDPEALERLKQKVILTFNASGGDPDVEI